MQNNLILLDEKIAEECLDGTDESRNQVKKNMIKLQYIQMDNTVKTTEILLDKKLDRVSNEKDLDRPLKRNDFNFMFSTLNLHHFSVSVFFNNHCIFFLIGKWFVSFQLFCICN